MLLNIPLESSRAVLTSLSASATYFAKKKMFKAILAKFKLKSLRGVSKSVRSRVQAEFNRQWKVYVKALRKNRKKPTTKTPNQQKYADHFRAMLKKYGVTSQAQLSKDQRSKFFSELKTSWRSKKGGGDDDAHADAAWQGAGEFNQSAPRKRDEEEYATI
jgi:DNA-binding protein H-NS